MSIINEYLKKVQTGTPAAGGTPHLPPGLAAGSVKRKKSRNINRRLLFAGTVILAAALSFWSESYLTQLFFNPGAEAGTDAPAAIQTSAPAKKGKDADAPLPAKKSKPDPNNFIISEYRKRALNEEPAVSVAAALEEKAGPKKNSGRSESMNSVVKAADSVIESSEKSCGKSAADKRMPAENRISDKPRDVHLKIREKKADTHSRSRSSSKEISRFYLLGVLAQKEKNYNEALRFYNKVLNKDSKHIDTLVNLTSIYIYQSKFSKAKEIIEKIKKIDPQNVKALVNSGTIDLYLQDIEKAKRKFQQALLLDSMESTALVNLAWISMQEGNTAKLKEYLEKVLDISPDNLDAILNYASLLENERRFYDAVLLYRKALTLNASRNNDELLAKKIKDRIRWLNGRKR